MPKGQPVSGKTNAWNDTTEKRLLLLMIAGTSHASKNWDEVAAQMGPSYSVSACRQKFAKLKAAIEKETGETISSGSPNKRAAPAVKTPNGTPKKRGRKRKESSDEDDSEDEIEPETPPKKMKKEGSAANRIIKEEDEEVQDLDDEEFYTLP
ncbi:hypothetical protein NA57DRAFT_81008 [Rhizodiscina lignyota]|uniref:Myb-like domain-containing protein n=1 Tax=Rhizodiscina lignyota TaxID=1504668 RepID=A0A9P4I780_9PEZI|nr:hypothetical protein NA57DRAFT_81008 [Rhizodiscina lignyota]